MSSKSKKKPLEQRVRVYLDDDPIEALEDARSELAEAEQAAQATYQRRLTLARQANPTPTELLAIEAGLDGERAAAVASARERVTAAEDAVRAASAEYVFRSPQIEREGKVLRGRRAFEELIAEHPPTDDDHDDTRKMTGRPEALARWHADTFTPALLSATCIDPGLSLEEATELYDEWVDGELGQLVAAALTVSQGARQVDLGKASRAATARV